nr:RagB/SusD family nutrient uptake outer membrane protein [uncultured Capnocytophaga sp.]
MKKYIIPLAFVGALSFTSCSKDNFDPDVNQYLTDERRQELNKNPEIATKLIQGELNGIYDNNIDAEESDVFGLKSIHLATDLSGLDMVLASWHWFGYDYYWNSRKADYPRPAFTWQFLYKQISAINKVFVSYFAEVPTDERLFQKYAELKSLRAVYYYYLVNLFQFSYKGNEDKLGVPLVLKPSDTHLPRATVAQVYDQILADFAVVDDPRFKTTSLKTDVDKTVAAAFLAKVYAHREEWDKVAQYAQVVMQTEGVDYTSLADVQAGKWDISMTSWLWGYNITQQTTSQWSSFYSNIDNTIGGYAGGSGAYKNIYSLLYNQIPDSDVRKQIYANTTLFPDIANRYEFPDYVSLKYATDDRFLGDYCFIRVEDPFLLYVEALVEQNKLGEAKTALESFVQQYRDPSYTLSATTQAEMREEVRFQRRVELWGEGTSFFDFKRWHLGADRTAAGSNHVFKVDTPANSSNWVYQIPKSEMESNPNMQQNP